MPYPAQTTFEDLIETAWRLVETEGVDRLSLNRVATAVGIKAPSLYNYVANKAALVKAINTLTLERLFAALEDAISEMKTPNDKLMALARAYRAFAHAHPTTYTLAFTTIEATKRPDHDKQLRMVLPLQAVVAQITGEADSLPAMRGLLALIHGYAMLELNQQLQRGGDLTATYEQVVATYLHGWDKSS